MKYLRLAIFCLAAAMIIGYTAWTGRRDEVKARAILAESRKSAHSVKKMSEQLSRFESAIESLRAQVVRLESRVGEVQESSAGAEKYRALLESQKDLFSSQLGTVKSEIQERQLKVESGVSGIKSRLDRLTKDVNQMIDSEGVKKVDLGRIKV